MVDKKYIDDMITNSDSNNQLCLLLRSKKEDVIKFICDYLGIDYDNSLSLMQMVYHYKEGICEIEKCVCGSLRKYHCYGYRNTCGDKKCVNIVREYNKKKTCLSKYGKEYVTQVDSVKKKMSDSIYEKYGVYNSTQSDKVLDKRRENNYKKYGYYETLSIPTIRDKIFETNLEKYGHKSPLGSELIREEIKLTNLIRYGYDNPQKNKVIRDKSTSTFVDNKLRDKIEILDNIGYVIISNDLNNFNLRCDKGHEFGISRSWLNLKIRNNIVICNDCLGVPSKSIDQTKIEEFIECNYNGEVISNDRTILNGKEIDIYIPELKLGIEYNGLYWHSELYKEDKYHLNKTELCEEVGIQLIHIFEDEWLYKKDIVKSRLLNILGKSNKIYARKCEIKEIDDNKEVRSFLNENHIQGFVGSKIKLGLYYDGDLVSLMTFGNLRKNLGQVSKEGSYELLRFCNKLNTSVIGGASKLFKYFVGNYNPEYILSYADRRWSQGGLYEKLGFEFIHDTVPNFFYSNENKIRMNRFNFRKDVLVKEGFDKEKTARQVMIERGYYRIYDCGSKKYSFGL